MSPSDTPYHFIDPVLWRIGPFEVKWDDITYLIGPFELRWYGLMYLIG